jgi:transcription initiation factor TFIIIB Brf1 subunit/transcription initiation factor TFIIB
MNTLFKKINKARFKMNTISVDLRERLRILKLKLRPETGHTTTTTSGTGDNSTGDGTSDGTGNGNGLNEFSYNNQFKSHIIGYEQTCTCCGDGVVVRNIRSGISGCTVCEYTEDDISISTSEAGGIWNETSSDQDVGNKYGLPTDPLLPTSSMGTLIGNGGGKFAYGGIRRIHKWLTMPYHERSLYDIFRQITELSDSASVFKMVVADTKLYYKIIHDKDENYVLTRGKTRKGVIAACLLYACNQRNIARTELEVANMFGLDIKTLTKGSKKFKEIMWKKGHKVYFDPISPLVYIERFCNILGINKEHIEIAKFIAYRCAKLNITDSNIPLSVTGGVIYTICTLYEYTSVNIKQIENITSVGDGTIIKFYKKVYPYMDLVLPAHILMETPMIKTKTMQLLMKSMDECEAECVMSYL